MNLSLIMIDIIIIKIVSHVVKQTHFVSAFLCTGRYLLLQYLHFHHPWRADAMVSWIECAMDGTER